MQNIVSISGGKDSTATLLVAIASEAENLSAVFADTGHEHPETYEYIEYLKSTLNVQFKTVKADFTKQIERKRNYISTKWVEQGVADSIVDRALDVLKPTGIPFLDLCLWKGRFPSSKARFCTEQLKVVPLYEQCLIPALDNSSMVLSWQGIRRDESFNRRFLPECDSVGGGLYNYRPILKWNVEAVFEAHRYMGVKWNPLYEQGCERVGCNPCIHEKKRSIANIARRWPWVIDRLEEWEGLVSAASKRGCSTFFCAVDDPMFSGAIDNINHTDHGIRCRVDWSKTARGGRQYDLIDASLDTKCSSAYGLCG